MHASSESLSNNPGRQTLLRRLWFRVLIYTVGIYVVWCTILYFDQDRMIFPAHLTQAPLNEPFSDDALVTVLPLPGGGEVESWYFPAVAADADKPRPLVILFHGNAELIDHQEDIVRLFRTWGCAVLLPEYRGYGRAGGVPSEVGIVEDCVRFYDEIVKRADIDKERIVFYGRSLGGGVAAQVAVHRKPAALILESTFTSVASMAGRYWAPRFLARHPFRTDLVLTSLDIPVLIFHGSRDTIIPVEHGRKLHALVPHGIYVEYDCGHNDFPGTTGQMDYLKRVRAFLVDSGILR
ncbi:MAG: alpha/beta hydrolase [Phycisphaerales bacterium]|nr:alpha/beta hydrolase [Phycisphaerales bacterium]